MTQYAFEKCIEKSSRSAISSCRNISDLKKGMLYNSLAKMNQWHNKDEILSNWDKGNESLSNTEEFPLGFVAQPSECFLQNFLHNDNQQCVDLSSRLGHTSTILVSLRVLMTNFSYQRIFYGELEEIIIKEVLFLSLDQHGLLTWTVAGNRA